MRTPPQPTASSRSGTQFTEEDRRVAGELTVKTRFSGVYPARVKRLCRRGEKPQAMIRRLIDAEFARLK